MSLKDSSQNNSISGPNSEGMPSTTELDEFFSVHSIWSMKLKVRPKTTLHPSSYKGEEYSECLADCEEDDEYGRGWCPTEKDSSGNYTAWEACHDNCQLTSEH